MKIADVVFGDVYSVRPLKGERAIAQGLTPEGLVVMATIDCREMYVAPPDLTPVSTGHGPEVRHHVQSFTPTRGPR